MSFVDDTSLTSELENLNMNGSYEPAESMGGPPAPPPPPGGASAGGPPPPPPPPPPGLGMPTYKEQKDQADHESGKSLAEKLSGGKKSESKPFSYGISAADLMTPSAIKRQNAAKAAAGSGGDTPSRPSTPLGIRQTPGDQAGDGSAAAPVGIKARASQIQSLQARSAPPDQSSSALGSQSSIQSFTPYQTAPTPIQAPKPPAPANEYGNGVHQSYGNRGSQQSIKPTATTPAYDHLSDWARNSAQSDDEGVVTSPSPSVYSRSSQPSPQQNYQTPQPQQPYQPQQQQMYQPPKQQYQMPQQPQHYEMPQQQQRSTPTLVRQESQGERSRAAQLLEQIRNTYSSGGASSPYEQNSPAEPARSPSSYAGQNTYDSPYQSQPRQAQGTSSYNNNNNNSVYPAPQKSQTPNRASPSYPQAQPSYGNQPGRQSVSPTPARPSYQTQSSYTSQPTTPAYINYGGQRPAPEPVAYRTLPYSSYVTPTNVDFNSDPFWNNSSSGFSQPQPQQQPRFTSQLRTEIQVPIHNSQSPDYYSSTPQRSQQNSYERIIPVQIQYQQMPAPKQNWGRTGLSDF